jgi:hypothetical protein
MKNPVPIECPDTPAQNYDGQIPLHLASHGAHLNLTRLPLDQGDDAAP